MKGALSPLIGILWLASATFNQFQSYPEVAALMSGLLASSLIGATYMGLPVAILEARIRRLRNSRRQKAAQQRLAIVFLIGLAGLGFGELLLIVPLLILSTVTIILSVMLLTMATTANAFAKMFQGKYNDSWLPQVWLALTSQDFRLRFVFHGFNSAKRRNRAISKIQTGKLKVA
jgi:heme A synthase